MRLLEATKEQCADYDKKARHRLGLRVSYPPPSTGTNYNLVDKVEYNSGDRVIWHIIYSPEGSFTYNYCIKSARRRRKRCPESECENFLEPGQRKCIECQLKTRKDRNRRHYQVLKARFKTGLP